jgi:DNA replication initiation complex subunit (GINS family)
MRTIYAKVDANLQELKEDIKTNKAKTDTDVRDVREEMSTTSQLSSVWEAVKKIVARVQL